MKNYEKKERDVMKMTDVELAESYQTIFPQKTDAPKEYESYPFTFKKFSLLKRLPISYSRHSNAKVDHA